MRELSSPTSGLSGPFPASAASTNWARYVAGQSRAVFVMDLEHGIFAYRQLDVADYNADDISPALVIDVQNNFHGADV